MCNGLYWENKRNWCYGADLVSRGLRLVDDDPFNDQCIEGVITDPCTGQIVQYPSTGFTPSTVDDDGSGRSNFHWDAVR